MNALETKLKELNGGLYSSLIKTVNEVTSLLTKYDSNFPTYTDHSLSHTGHVFNLASQLLTSNEINNLNEDELYVLSMACYLHDIGMCIPEEKIKEIGGTEDFLRYKEVSPNLSIEEYIRDIHHELSNKFILNHWKLLHIPDEKYAKAIGLVAQGHRKVDLGNLDEYPTKFFVKNGREFVCLPFISSILRIADELDITSVRTPTLLSKYYLPNNERSKTEWLKHIATTQVNFSEDFVTYDVKCSDHNMLTALETQFEKIQKTLHYCQKIIRTIGNTESRRFTLSLMRVVPKYEFANFDPKGIKFSFDVQNVTKTFIGEDLYDEPLTAIREAVQNSIDSCLYRKKIASKSYSPSLVISMEPGKLIITDNGLGMDEFIIENFFGRLGSSFYEQSEIKNKFDAIGQFGVGVFSYFLISDFIEVLTKTEHGPSLHFRINNDPKSYFHFYDKPNLVPQGTTLVLNLKPKFSDELKFHKIKNYLVKYFRYIEFPIEIIDKVESFVINGQPIELDSDFEIKDRIGIEHKEQVPNLEVLTVKIENERLRGECGVIFRKIRKDFSFSDTLFHLDYQSFERSRHSRSSYCEVGIYQKGVFVNAYGSNYLAGVIGNLNLIEKERLNINRQEFSNPRRILSIIGQFEVKIIDLVFDRLSQIFNSERLSELTQEFIEEYLSISSSDKSEELRNVLKNRFFVEVYDDNKTRFISIETLIQEYDSFLLIGNFEKKKTINKNSKLPVIICQVEKNNTMNFLTMKRIFHYILEYYPSIIKLNGLGFQKFSKNVDIENYREIDTFWTNIEFYFPYIEPCDDNVLMSSVWYGKKGVNLGTDELFWFNSNNPFIKKLVTEKARILESREMTKICNSCLNFISEFYGWRYGEDIVLSVILEKLNKMVEPLNRGDKFYEFQESDFFNPSAASK